MIYDNLYSDFKSLFSEKNDLLNRLSNKANAEETDGMHIMFSFVVIPFVLILLKNEDVENLKKAFSYFEKMALSDISDITEVLEFTVIENLMSNGDKVFEDSKKYMGNEMLKCCETVKKYLNVSNDKYNEPIKQDKELKKISDLDIMKIRKKK